MKVPNTRAGFLALTEQIGAWKPRPDSAVIVGVESTGSYGVNLVRWLSEHGCRVVLVPSLHVCREKELLDNGRGTNDDKDALISPYGFRSLTDSGSNCGYSFRAKTGSGYRLHYGSHYGWDGPWARFRQLTRPRQVRCPSPGQ